MLLDVEAQLGLERREHVLPDRVARAGVVEPDRLVAVARLELLQVLARLGAIVSWVHFAASAAPRENCSSGSAPHHAEVVVAGEADRRVAPRELDARVGIGAVADEVAEAPHLLALGGLDPSSTASNAWRLPWMSETIAIRIATVSLVKRRPRRIRSDRACARRRGRRRHGC